MREMKRGSCAALPYACAFDPERAATGGECPVDGNNFCLTCPDGFSTVAGQGQNTQTCEANVCRCEHGAPVEGKAEDGVSCANEVSHS